MVVNTPMIARNFELRVEKSVEKLSRIIREARRKAMRKTEKRKMTVIA